MNWRAWDDHPACARAGSQPGPRAFNYPVSIERINWKRTSGAVYNSFDDATRG